MKRMLNKRNITTLLAIGCLQIFAQKPTNEFTIYGGVGLPIMVSNETVSIGFAGDIGLGFTTFANRHIAFHFGAGLGFNTIKIDVDDLKTQTFGLRDENGLLFDKHTTLSDYREIQKTTLLNIPLMLQFQPKTQGFYAMCGAKIIFWQKTNYETKIGTLHNLAYYPELGNWSGTQEFANFGPFNGTNTTGNFNLGLYTILAFETGMKWKINEQTFLYAGLYLDYYLDDPAKNQRKSYSEYITPNHLNHLTLLSFADNINAMTIGLKLRLSFAGKPETVRKRVPCPMH
jgi:hypothetical protein